MEYISTIYFDNHVERKEIFLTLKLVIKLLRINKTP